MRVVFDARHLQTVSRTRGIGRYSRNLLAAFARRAPEDIEWTLLTLGTFAPADHSPLPPHRTRATLRLRRPELTMLALDALLLPVELARQGDLYHSVQLGLPAVRRVPAVLTIHDLAPLMRAALARSGLDPGRVVITGGVDDPTLAALYAGAECLLHAAWLEGFGLTALEALAAGTPVVGYRAGAVAEVVGEAGLLVDEQDAGALGDALVTLLADEGLRDRLAERAKPRAARFSWDRAADDTLAVYRSVR